MPDNDTPLNRRVYLGDGVYVHWNGFHVMLETSDGYSATNSIALELSVLRAFLHWVHTYIFKKEE